MDIENLNYYLPPELIAQKPAPNRTDSKLLVLNRSTGSVTDDIFRNIAAYLQKGDCLVINNTKVIPAKFFAQKPTGAHLEGLFLTGRQNEWKVMLKNSSRIKEGQTLYLLDRNKKQYCPALATKKLSAGQWLVKLDSPLAAEEILQTIGFAPLPPYIKRPQPQAEHQLDCNRYQTVYAQQNGAIAAPTAGLHFTEKILEQIRAKGVNIAQLTLHVGAGTFLPVKTQTLEEHKMHSEQFSIDDENAAVINNTILAGGKIIAVGTTTARTLETIAVGRKVKPAAGQTNLFITPGFEFKIIDCLITNFHLPKSTLLALVAAFAGLDKILAAYKYAVGQKYRFYSYGDCMIII
ncbi:MAG: tRNA preQ1(34) S-adenosylmethionine ribosyltransferase-isomerase QueA [Planctomycetes bacterium RBG_13_44_8b]|nr:MAG: tRNA preQ1(34) S-adenosylmethionine ribosyltransferase-isomerase QueA [Planctomycetes bacterium RBG_13_44_8b]